MQSLHTQGATASFTITSPRLVAQDLREVSSNALSIYRIGELIKKLSEEGDLDSDTAAALGQAVKTLGASICWDSSLFEIWEAAEGASS